MILYALFFQIKLADIFYFIKELFLTSTWFPGRAAFLSHCMEWVNEDGQLHRSNWAMYGFISSYKCLVIELLLTFFHGKKWNSLMLQIRAYQRAQLCFCPRIRHGSHGTGEELYSFCVVWVSPVLIYHHDPSVRL